MENFNLLFLAFLFIRSQGTEGQAIQPLSTRVAEGDGVSLECTTAATGGFLFSWLHIPEEGDTVILFNGGFKTPPEGYDNFNVSESPADQRSTLIINDIQWQDRGGYRCAVTGQPDVDPANVVVEVQPPRETMTLNSSPDYTNYIATCASIGSFPGETITWSLNGNSQTDGVVPTGPTERDDSLFDTTSEFTFPATIENYNVELQCIFGGHQVDKLNGPETRLVDIHNPPEAEGITIGFNSDGTDLTVSCEIKNAVDAAIPPMGSFYIYSNGTLITKSVSANSVTVSEPDYDTEYMCVGENYLGNTTAIETFYPGRTTTPPPTTAPDTTEPVVVGPTTNPTAPDTTEPVVVVPTGTGGTGTGSTLSPLMIGIAVLVILLVASIIINIVQFIILKRKTLPEFDESKKNDKRNEVNTHQEGNDNVAYEMIQSGDRAYTALKLDPSHSFVIARENVTFFTRLGSIGRGDFGEVWKGDLRLKRDHLDVVIRQIPDRVTKSLQVLQAIKILYKLSDQPNIAKCLGYCKEQGSILYEFISGGTLLTHLQTSGVQSQPTYSNLKPNGVRIEEDTLLNLAWQVAKGMQFLASKKIIHGTLCAHNVLLGERKQCKISDYGLSSSLFSDQSKATRWSSPETMVTSDQTTEGDIWSFGIVLWEIVTLGARPYPNMTFTTVQTEVANGYQMQRPRHCAQEVYTVMTDCWEKDPTNRTNFDRILKDLERILEKNHSYLSLNDLDERLYASTIDV